jgi:seryl-tRNA synthetase
MFGRKMKAKRMWVNVLENALQLSEQRVSTLLGEVETLNGRIKELEGELRKTPVCGLCPDTQRLYQEVESWKSQSKTWEKRYAECDAALKSASRMPPITERKVWRVCGAKGMQLIVLEGATTNPVTASEFWRAARKLGIPVDEVGNHKIVKDVMVFQCKGHLASLPPGPSAIETSVYVIE